MGGVIQKVKMITWLSLSCQDLIVNYLCLVDLLGPAVRRKKQKEVEQVKEKKKNKHKKGGVGMLCAALCILLHGCVSK